MTARPTSASQALGAPRSPSDTSVASSVTTRPALRSPRKARKQPTPAMMATFRLSGIATTIACRTPMTLSTTKRIPEMNTAPSAVRQSIPMPSTTVKEKKALSPMPGAWAKGYRATSPMSRQPTLAATAVVISSWTGAPGTSIAAPRTCGLTKST